MITIVPTYLFIWRKWTFGYFREKNSPSFKRTHLYWDTFTKLSLSNIMKHIESDVEWQISIQGIHLNAFGNYFLKREGRFKWHQHRLTDIFYSISIDWYILLTLEVNKTYKSVKATFSVHKLIPQKSLTDYLIH